MRQGLDELAEVLEFQAERLREHGQYRYGLECLVGFLLAQLQARPGWSAEHLLAALAAEQRGQPAEGDRTHLLPFARLVAVLSCQAGGSVEIPDLPKELSTGYPRLAGAPPGLRPVPNGHWPHE